jgi:hypothetical protein
VANDQAVPYNRVLRMKLIANRTISPSMSIACPVDLEHRAPEVSMKNTWLLLAGILRPSLGYELADNQRTGNDVLSTRQESFSGQRMSSVPSEGQY